MVKWGFLLALSAFGCAPLNASQRRPPALAEFLRNSPFTVVEFFSAKCSCQLAHDERLKALANEFQGRGVQFVAVDSEAFATPQVDAAERAGRGYPYPVITDASGQWASALGAEFATYVVVLDRSGAVRYRGGIDSDQAELTAGAMRWLGDALAALVDGREPSARDTKPLGCILHRS
jgi:hypothetical protein